MSLLFYAATILSINETISYMTINVAGPWSIPTESESEESESVPGTMAKVHFPTGSVLSLSQIYLFLGVGVKDGWFIDPIGWNLDWNCFPSTLIQFLPNIQSSKCLLEIGETWAFGFFASFVFLVVGVRGGQAAWFNDLILMIWFYDDLIWHKILLIWWWIDFTKKIDSDERNLQINNQEIAILKCLGDLTS